ncbi:MAG: LptF/LptG family permease [Calditrichia bacterium]
MKIITRYIVKDLAWPFFFSLAVIMFVFITKFILQYIGKIFGKGLPVMVIFEFIYLNLAWMMALAVPMAVLIASLMAYGRLSADNEITIFRASGINLYRIIAPALLAGTMLTIAMVIYNDVVLPEFNHQARLLMRSITRKKPTFSLEEGLYLKRENLNILVEKIRRADEEREQSESDLLSPNAEFTTADKLEEITIFDFNNRTQFQRTIIADYGYLVFDKERAQMLFNLFDGEIHEVSTRDYSEYRRILFDKTVIYMEASDQILTEIQEGQRGDREMTISMMQETINQKRQAVDEEQEKLSNASKTYLIEPDIIAKRLSDSTYSARDLSLITNASRTAMSKASRKAQNSLQMLTTAMNNQAYFGKQISKYQVEIYKKYSIPFACIVFVLVGAPLGIRARKGSLGVSVTFSIAFFLVYWICLIGGEDLADRQIVHPMLAMWFPNILVGFLGLWLTYKTVHETSFINWNRLPKALQVFLRGDD